jgi:hypothetical protein
MTAPESDTPAGKREYFSLGHLAGRFQRPVTAVRRILASANIEPMMTINDVEYFEGAAAYDALERAAGQK